MAVDFHGEVNRCRRVKKLPAFAVHIT